MKPLTLIALGLTTLAIGCGDESTSDNPPGLQAGESSPSEFTEQDVIQAAGLKLSDTGISYDTPAGCDAAVILTNAAEVELYAGAGDTVVTNPDGTAGYKTDDDPRCVDEGTAALASLD